MSGKSAKDYEADYTEPELRARLKEEIKGGDRGGRPGQWSARKSQLLTTEYEKAGGYEHEGRRTESQKHLDEWTKQDWHTADGGSDARGEDGTARYLPDAAWQLLSPEEQEATDTRKKQGDAQHVANTDAAKQARKAAELIDDDAQLDRARRAEEELGRGRKTVLRQIQEQRSKD